MLPIISEVYANVQALRSSGDLELQVRLYRAIANSPAGTHPFAGALYPHLFRAGLQLQDAAAMSEGIDALRPIAEAEIPDGASEALVDYIVERSAAARHDLAVAESVAELAAGRVDVAAVHRDRVTAVFDGDEGLRKTSERIGTHVLFLLEFELGRMNPARLLRLVDRFQADGTLSELTEGDLERVQRLRVAALSEQALTDADRVQPALELLKERLESGSPSRPARLDLLFRIARIFLNTGNSVGLSELKAHIPADLDSPMDRTLAASLVLATTTGDTSAEESAWEREFEALLATLEAKPPREDGTGILHFDNAAFCIHMGVAAAIARGEDGSLDALERLIRPMRAQDLGRRMGATGISARTFIERTLRPGEAVLMVSPAPGFGFGAFVLDGDITLFRVADSARMRAAVDGLRQVVARAPEGDAAEREAQWLERSAAAIDCMLPVELHGRILGAKRLVVVAPDLCWNMPFEALFLGNGALGNQVPVATIPSPHILHALRSRPAPGASGIRIVANVPERGWEDPLDSGLMAPLVGDERLQAWSAPLNGEERVQVATGADGAVEAVAKGLFKGTEVGVLFAHGSRLKDRSRHATLLLGGAADQGRLGAAAIESMPVSDIMVLATCRAATGALRLGGGSSTDLGGAFLFAKSRAVLVSAADLPKLATEVFVTAFLGALRSGHSVGESARLARVEVSETPGLDHPFFYANLSVLGLPELCVAPLEVAQGSRAGSEPGKRWGWWLGGLLIFGAALALRRRRSNG